VARLNRRDRSQGWTIEQWEDVELPVLTCEPVLTEACFLLRRSAGGPAAILELVGRAAIKVAYNVEADVEGLAKLMTRYAEVPMSLADACLVRMIERQPHATVFALDGDFHVYRSHGRRVIPALMPSDI
jgi:predicted nucleic acid-binding protein